MGSYRRDDAGWMVSPSLYTPAVSPQIAHLARLERQRRFWRFVARCGTLVLLAICADEFYRVFWH
jgi:hypothetical protein